MNQEGAFPPPHRRGNLSAAVVVITTVTVTVSVHKQKILDLVHGLILFTGRWNSFGGRLWFSDNNGGLQRVRLLNVRVGKVERLSDWAGGQKQPWVNDLRRTSHWRPHWHCCDAMFYPEASRQGHNLITTPATTSHGVQQQCDNMRFPKGLHLWTSTLTVFHTSLLTGFCLGTKTESKKICYNRDIVNLVNKTRKDNSCFIDR